MLGLSRQLCKYTVPLLVLMAGTFVGCEALQEGRRGMREAMYEAGGLLRPSQGAVGRKAREIEESTMSSDRMMMR